MLIQPLGHVAVACQGCRLTLGLALSLVLAAAAGHGAQEEVCSTAPDLTLDSDSGSTWLLQKSAAVVERSRGSLVVGQPGLRNGTAHAAAPATANASSAPPEIWIVRPGQLPRRVRPGNATVTIKSRGQVEEKVEEWAVAAGLLPKVVKTSTAEEVHNLAKDAILPFTGVMMLSLLLGSILSSFKLTSFIPETLSTVLVSITLGLLIRRLISVGLVTLDNFVFVDASLLNLMFLPIIIFEGGWSVNHKYFMKQFPYICIFAVLGTVLSTIAIGNSSWALANWMGFDGMKDWKPNFVFAALISATDPVATLAAFAQMKIAERQPLLNVLVFGEAMLNDAVAITMFQVLNTHGTHHGPQTPILPKILSLLFGSILFGSLVAACLVLFMRLAKLPGQTLPEIIYMFLSPYFIYSLAESFQWSGIIATLFAGIVFKLYGSLHLTGSGQRQADEFLEVTARLADAGVFVICGTSTAFIDSLEGLQFGLLAVGLCLFGRWTSVFWCSWVSNALKSRSGARQQMISWRHAFMIWLSGLRGGIALVLALEIETEWCPPATKSLIVNTTFIVICTLLLICGSSTEFALKALGMVPTEDEPQLVTEDGTPMAYSDLEDEDSDRGFHRVVARHLDSFLMYVLVGSSSAQAARPVKTGTSEGG